MNNAANYRNYGRSNYLTVVCYNRATFDSFVELADLRRNDKRFNPGVSLRYDGSDICGTVEIGFGHNIEDADISEFTKIAGQTLKLF